MSIVACPNCGAKNRVDQTRADRLQPVCGRCGQKLQSAPEGVSRQDSRPITVTDASFASELSSAGSTPVLVDCWAPWCGPCRAIAPIMDQLAVESVGCYVIAKLNVDDNPRTAAQYRVEGISTMLLFKNGRVVDRVVGLQPKQAIAAKLAQHI